MCPLVPGTGGPPASASPSLTGLGQVTLRAQEIFLRDLCLWGWRMLAALGAFSLQKRSYLPCKEAAWPGSSVTPLPLHGLLSESGYRTPQPRAVASPLASPHLPAALSSLSFPHLRLFQLVVVPPAPPSIPSSQRQGTRSNGVDFVTEFPWLPGLGGRTHTMRERAQLAGWWYEEHV